MDQKLSNNGNWKGGRSKNNYFYTKQSRQRYPDRENVRKVVYRAVRSGKLVRPQYCQHSQCFETQVFAHHIDYNEPLAVLWFCRKHHSDIHNRRFDLGEETTQEQMDLFNKRFNEPTQSQQ